MKKFIEERVVEIVILTVSFLLLAAGFVYLQSSSESEVSTSGAYIDAEHLFAADVSDDTILVYVISDGKKMLYWKGSWTSGPRVSSQADTEVLAGAILGSQDPAKLFTVHDGQIRFDGSMYGTHFNVVLTKEN